MHHDVTPVHRIQRQIHRGCVLLRATKPAFQLRLDGAWRVIDPVTAQREQTDLKQHRPDSPRASNQWWPTTPAQNLWSLESPPNAGFSMQPRQHCDRPSAHTAPPLSLNPSSRQTPHNHHSYSHYHRPLRRAAQPDAAIPARAVTLRLHWQLCVPTPSVLDGYAGVVHVQTRLMNVPV